MHGIGGSGKSSLAQYLCDFHKTKYNQIFYTDLSDMNLINTNSIDNFLEFFLEEALDREIIDIDEYKSKDDYEAHPIKTKLKKITNIVLDKLDNSNLIVLDNLELIAQDKQGVLKKEWLELINYLKSKKKIFLILASRLVPYLNQRDSLDNILKVDYFQDYELKFLYQRLDKNEQSYLNENYESIYKLIGLHPLGINFILQEKQKILNPKILQNNVFNNIFDFYRPYLQSKEFKFLLIFSLPISRVLFETFFSDNFISLISNKLLLLDEDLKGLRLKPIIQNYFLSILDDETSIKKDFLEQIGQYDIEYTQNDLANILYFNIDTNKDSNKILDCFNQYINRKEGVELDNNYLKKIIDIVDLLAKTNDADLTDVATSQHNLAVLLNDLNRKTEALGLHEEALKTHKLLAKTNDAYLPYVATNQNTLAILLDDLNRKTEALGLHEEALKTRKLLAKTNDAYLPDVAMSQHNLAILLDGLNRKTEALGLSKEALKILKLLAKTNDAYLPYVATNQNTLAILLDDLNRKTEALGLYEEALKTRKLLAKTNDAYLPDVAMSQNNLAILLRDLNRKTEALGLSKEALKTHKLLAKTNDAYLPDVATSQNILALLLNDLNRKTEALGLYEEALKTRKLLAKTNDAYLPDVATSQNNLAVLLYDLSRRTEALGLYEEALKTLKLLAKTNAAYLPDVATSQNNLAVLLDGLNRNTEALGLYEEALKTRKLLAKTNDAYLPYVATSQNNLALLLDDLNRKTEALGLYEEALVIFKKIQQFQKAYQVKSKLLVIYFENKDYQKIKKIICEYLQWWDVYKKQDRIYMVLLKDGLIKSIDIDDIFDEDTPARTKELFSLLCKAESFY